MGGGASQQGVEKGLIGGAGEETQYNIFASVGVAPKFRCVPNGVECPNEVEFP